MCGIVGYVGKKKNALKFLMDGLKNLEYRGYDSSGIAYFFNDNLKIIKEVGSVCNLNKKIDFLESSNIGIGHTRWATHGMVSIINSHPIKSGAVTIVHNGILENYEELKLELIGYGYIFKTDTDTEVACALIDYFYKKFLDVNLALEKFYERAMGSYAIVIMIDNIKDKLYVIRRKSPIVIGVGDGENYVASDMAAIGKYANKYILLDDFDIAHITCDDVSLFNNGKIKDIVTIDFLGDEEIVDKGGYDHYLIKEINEEPDVIRNTMQEMLKDNFLNFDIFDKYKRIVIVACGSAYHAGLVGKYLIEEYGNVRVDVEIASEFRYKKLFLDKDTLVIAISQSGETADTLEAIKIAQSLGCYSLGIVNVLNSSIAREVDKVFYTKALKEVSVATTKVYLAQCEVLALIAYYYAKKNNEFANTVSDFLNDLNKLPIVVQDIISRDDEYQEIAKDIYNNDDIFYIGRGIDYALCMEGALKLKEISYIHSEAYAAGELKHGTISLVDSNTFVFGIITDQSIFMKTISNLKEVKARGAKIIGLVREDLKLDDFLYKKVIIPRVNPLLQPLISIIPLQIIAYYVAKFRGCDIDKPKNLAKSVTVE